MGLQVCFVLVVCFALSLPWQESLVLPGWAPRREVPVHASPQGLLVGGTGSQSVRPSFLSCTCSCLSHNCGAVKPHTSYGVKLFLITLHIIIRVLIQIEHKLAAILSRDFPLVFLCLASILDRKYA